MAVGCGARLPAAATRPVVCVAVLMALFALTLVPHPSELSAATGHRRPAPTPSLPRLGRPVPHWPGSTPLLEVQASKPPLLTAGYGPHGTFIVAIGALAALGTLLVWALSPLNPIGKRLRAECASEGPFDGVCRRGPVPSAALAAALCSLSLVVPSAQADATPAPAPSQTVVRGTAQALDGDTLSMKGPEGATTKVRLAGVDAPELRQMCEDASGAPYPCGKESREYLQQLVQGKEVECFETVPDRYQRILAVCFDTVSRKDLNAAVVAAGQAVADTRRSDAYGAEEAAARAAKVGLWRGTFQTPADWRRAQRAASNTTAETEDPATAPTPAVPPPAAPLDRLSAPPPPIVAGQTIVAGVARVVDGDTLVITGPAGTTTRIRMMGIDAPESTQSCLDAKGGSYLCGAASKDSLDRLIGGRPVECFASKLDMYGRVLGVCFDPSTGRDLNQTQVATGEAVAYTEYSKAYVDDEERAQRAGQGIWQGTFQRPAEYRRAQRAAK